jgi:uncharacterized lipoprotein
MRFKILLLTFVALSLLSACSNKSNVLPSSGYRTARAQSSLELPPDLVNSSASSLVQAANQSDNAALAPLEGIKLRSSGDKRWLEIEANADDTWFKVVDYFNKSGMPILTENKRDGILETDWIGDEESDSYAASLIRNKVGNLFGRAPVNDKFTAWLEILDEQKTAVHISHNQLKQFIVEPTSQKNKNIEAGWVETPGDGLKALKLMRDMAAFFGGRTIETENTAHVVLVQTPPVQIILDETGDKAWTLVERAIITSPYTLDGENREKNLFEIRTAKEKGFWAKIKLANKYGVVLEPAGNSKKTRIRITDKKGKDIIERPEALPVLWAIAGELRRLETTTAE